MADRAFSTLFGKVAPSAPGCPQPLMLQYIRDAAIRTCERTLLWRYSEPKFSLEAGRFIYPYAKPSNADVHVLFDAVMNNTPLEKLTLEQAIASYPEWADNFAGLDIDDLWQQSDKGALNENQFNTITFNGGSEFVLPPEALEGTSQPRIVCQLTPDQYIVLPNPDDVVTYSMRMFYALKPKRDAVSMPSAVLDEIEDVIVHGALQQLLVMPNVAWADRELASYHARQYLFHAMERRARANLGNMRGSMLVRGPRFA